MPPLALSVAATQQRSSRAVAVVTRTHLCTTPSSLMVFSVQVLKGHDDHVITCLQFCGNRIVSGSDDNTLKVWSAVTGEVSCCPTSCHRAALPAQWKSCRSSALLQRGWRYHSHLDGFIWSLTKVQLGGGIGRSRDCMSSGKSCLKLGESVLA